MMVWEEEMEEDKGVGVGAEEERKKREMKRAGDGINTSKSGAS